MEKVVYLYLYFNIQKCNKLLPCGHKCEGICKICQIKGHKECIKGCNNKCNTLLKCGHICNGLIYECFKGLIHIECEKCKDNNNNIELYDIESINLTTIKNLKENIKYDELNDIRNKINEKLLTENEINSNEIIKYYNFSFCYIELLNIIKVYLIIYRN